MGFSWTTISVGDEVTAAVAAEFRTHLNTLFSDLSLTTYSWTQSVPTQDQIIPAAQFTEFKTATDYADDMNYCRGHDAIHYTTHNGSQDSGRQTSHNASHDNGDVTSDYYSYTPNSNAVDFQSECSSEDSGFCDAEGNICAGHDSSYDFGVATQANSVAHRGPYWNECSSLFYNGG